MQNAFKHGLTAQQLVIKPQDLQTFDDLLARHQGEIEPQGALQQTLFNELVTAAWNLRRVRILQASIDMLDPQFDRLSRIFHRARKELKALHTDARLNAMLPRGVRHKTPFLAAPLVIAKRSQQRDQERQSSPVPSSATPP